MKIIFISKPKNLTVFISKVSTFTPFPSIRTVTGISSEHFERKKRVRKSEK